MCYLLIRNFELHISHVLLYNKFSCPVEVNNECFTIIIKQIKFIVNFIIFIIFIIFTCSEDFSNNSKLQVGANQGHNILQFYDFALLYGHIAIVSIDKV